MYNKFRCLGLINLITVCVVDVFFKKIKSCKEFEERGGKG